MRYIERRLDVTSRSEWICIYPLFDTHIGTIHCREDMLKRIISEIAADKNRYWLAGGDMCEFINRSDPRHKESDLAPWVHGKDDLAREQIRHFLELFAPIAHKCIGVLSGNHEAQIFRHTERNVYGNILEALKDMGGIRTQLGVGYGGFIVLRVNRSGHTSTLIIFAEHGFGGGRLKGADVLNEQRVFSYYDCDLYLTGHRHKCNLIPHTRVQVSNGRVEKFTKYAATVGSFRDRTVDISEDDPGGYEDLKAYPPGDLAGVKIWFSPSTNEMRGEVYSY